jgi:hypothetical protein
MLSSPWQNPPPNPLRGSTKSSTLIDSPPLSTTPPSLLDHGESDYSYEYIEEEDALDGDHSPSRGPIQSSQRYRPTRAELEDPDGVEDQLLQLVEHRRQPQPDYRNGVLHSLNRKKVEALLHSDYDKAQLYEDAIQSIINHESKHLTSQLTGREHDQSAFRKETIEQKLQSSSQQLKEAIQSNQSELNQKLLLLQGAHRDEIAEFKGRWRNPDFLKQFARPSTQMLEMRYVEKKLALQKRYADAKKMKEMADRQQLFEENVLKRNIESQLRSEYQRLLERHQNEIDRLETFYAMSNLRLEMKLEKTVRALEMALRQCEVPRLQIATTKRIKASTITATTAPQNAVLTPRTQQAYLQFRTRRNADLRLPQVDDILSGLPAPRNHSATRVSMPSMSRQGMPS